MSGKLTAVVDAWEQTARSLTDLCTSLDDTEWNVGTECPGWSVRDVVSHVIGMERELLGDPTPWHQLPRDLVHVRTDTQRYLEIPVDLRRCHTPVEMEAELREVVARRTRMLHEDGRGPDDEATLPLGGKLTYLGVLSIRVFDVWAHEQDVRRAVGRPGNLAGPAAEISRDRICAALPRVVARDAGAPPDTVALFDVSGPLSFTKVVRVDGSGRGALVTGPAPAPTVALALDWETFLRLTCGRVRPDAVDVKIEGTEDLARRILARLAITP